MTNVAAAAGVSVASVSNVINQRRVSDRIRKRVMKAIKGLGYQHNLAARALKTGVSNIIGVIIPTLSNPYYSDMVELIIDAARKRGFVVAMIDTQNSHHKERESLDFLLQHAVQGIIWYGPRSSQEAIEKYTQGRQVVVVDRALEPFDSIVPDYKRGGFSLARYVISQGHRKIGLISGPQDNYGARMRRTGILKAVKGKATIVWECENHYSEILSTECLDRILERSVSAIMCANDQIAIGTLLALRSSNIIVPDEVSVTGFDNIHLCELICPRLTSVTVPKASVVEEAVSLIIDRVRGHQSPRRHLSLELELVVRDSVSSIQLGD